MGLKLTTSTVFKRSLLPPVPPPMRTWLSALAAMLMLPALVVIVDSSVFIEVGANGVVIEVVVVMVVVIFVFDVMAVEVDEVDEVIVVRAAMATSQCLVELKMTNFNLWIYQAILPTQRKLLLRTGPLAKFHLGRLIFQDDRMMTYSRMPRSRL